jgi:hypothetical protein
MPMMAKMPKIGMRYIRCGSEKGLFGSMCAPEAKMTRGY